MSRSELTDAYVRGRISRQSFVRGMVALGASLTTAVAMAETISAAPGATISGISRDVYYEPPKKDEYPPKKDEYPPKKDEYPPKKDEYPTYKPEPEVYAPAGGTTTYGVTVASLPSTGVAGDNASPAGAAVVAAGAAAAALVAMRMRQAKTSESDVE